jgi:hypothetical protein
MMDIVVGASTPKVLRSEHGAGTLMGNQAPLPIALWPGLQRQGRATSRRRVLARFKVKSHDVEIAVVGAGIVGIATAYYLALQHKRSRLLIVDVAQPMTLTSAQSGENYRNFNRTRHESRHPLGRHTCRYTHGEYWRMRKPRMRKPRVRNASSYSTSCSDVQVQARPGRNGAMRRRSARQRRQAPESIGPCQVLSGHHENRPLHDPNPGNSFVGRGVQPLR